MRDHYRRPIFLVLVLALLASAGQAQEHLRLKGGERLAGNAKSYDETREVVTFVTTDGVVHEIAAKDLDPRSAYSIAKSRAKDRGAEAQLRVGNFARDIELYAHAARHYERAEKEDPSLKPAVEKERVRLRSEAAEYCMRHAQEAIDKNDDKGAEKWLTLLVEKLPDEPQAQEASELLESYYSRNHEVRDDRLEEKYADVVAKELQKGKKAYDKMLDEIQKGLVNRRNTSAAKRHFDTAWKEGEHALWELDNVQKKIGPRDAKLGELFDGYRALVKEHMVASQLHLASVYATETSYKRALKSVNLALSIDPKNREALEARVRIESDADNNRILGW